MTATSIETLQNLQALLTERGRQLLSSTALLVPSRRIVAAAVGAGLRGEAIVAAGADDASMIGALAQWRMRPGPARAEPVLPYTARVAHSHAPHLLMADTGSEIIPASATPPERREHAARIRIVA